MKTKEELNEIKEEYERMCKKLTELTGEELAQVTGAGKCESLEVSTPAVEDSDMAKELTDWTKPQTMPQPGQEMLAQSNQRMVDALTLRR